MFYIIYILYIKEDSLWRAARWFKTFVYNYKKG